MNPYDLNAIGKILKSQPSGISWQLIARLATENKKLSARITELEAERRWIPFDWEHKENQPDHMQVCLVLTTDNEMYSAMFLSDNCWTGLCRDFCKYEVAYWMQSPEPPEVEE